MTGKRDITDIDVTGRTMARVIRQKGDKPMTPSCSAPVSAIQANIAVVMAGSVPEPAASAGRHDGLATRLGRRRCLGRSSQPASHVTTRSASRPAAHNSSGKFPPVRRRLRGRRCGVVDDAQYRQRLEICRTCDRRTGKRCTACGCWITVKARGRVFRCPIGRWE